MNSYDVGVLEGVYSCWSLTSLSWWGSAFWFRLVLLLICGPFFVTDTIWSGVVLVLRILKILRQFVVAFVCDFDCYQFLLCPEDWATSVHGVLRVCGFIFSTLCAFWGSYTLFGSVWVEVVVVAAVVAGVFFYKFCTNGQFRSSHCI